MIEYLEKWRELHAYRGASFNWLDSVFDTTEQGERDLTARMDAEVNAMKARRDLVLEYAWAVPTEEALDLIAQFAPIVEIGAGGGYWAYLLRERGVDVAAYDISPGPRSKTEGQSRDRRVWTEVLEGEPDIAAEHPDRALFLCWPPLSDSMAQYALRAYLEAGGKYLIYVGESEGGCNADDDFFNLVGEEMEELSEIAVPQWIGLHDYLTVYEAKRAES